MSGETLDIHEEESLFLSGAAIYDEIYQKIMARAEQYDEEGRVRSVHRFLTKPIGVHALKGTTIA